MGGLVVRLAVHNASRVTGQEYQNECLGAQMSGYETPEELFRHLGKGFEY